MKVIGLGAPDMMRIRFPRRELDSLVDQLRKQRARATQHATGAYARPRPDDRAIDDAHDDLRAAERLLGQLEDAARADEDPIELTGATETLREIIVEGARDALSALGDLHDRFTEPGGYEGHDPDALLAAARSVKTWIGLQVALRRVDLGPNDD